MKEIHAIKCFLLFVMMSALNAENKIMSCPLHWRREHRQTLQNDLLPLKSSKPGKHWQVVGDLIVLNICKRNEDSDRQNSGRDRQITSTAAPKVFKLLADLLLNLLRFVKDFVKSSKELKLADILRNECEVDGSITQRKNDQQFDIRDALL